MTPSRRRKSGLPRFKPFPGFKPLPGLKPLPGIKPLKGLPGLPGPRVKVPAGPVDPNTLNLLERAIAEREPITAMYTGKHRELSPLDLGMKNGELHLWAYQFGGESDYRCKCFVVAKLSEVDAFDGPWQEPTRDRDPGSCIA
jgi:hypothetical protein